MKLRVFDLAGGDMDYEMNAIFKNPSVLPMELLAGKDPLLKVMVSTERLDKNKTEVFEADVVEFVNAQGETMRAVCEFGTVHRRLEGAEGVINNCEIRGFYFRLLDSSNRPSWRTFPIVSNYEGKSDYELFEVIGNTYENPELVA